MGKEMNGKGTKIYEEVLGHLKEMISSGEIRPGDALPSERKLVMRFGVSRSSLREALRVMELLGLIESIPGKGRLVREPQNGENGDARLEDSTMAELMAARRLIDPIIASEAAAHATHADCLNLTRIVRDTEAHLSEMKPRAKADYDFHLALAEAAHNFVFVNITKMDFGLLIATHEKIYDVLEDRNAFLAEHRAICDAVCTGDAEAARTAATRHIDRISAVLLAGIEAKRKRGAADAAETEQTPKAM
jgi:GntR family transcriptional repressor for pyruvate dehydrogenase complex